MYNDADYFEALGNHKFRFIKMIDPTFMQVMQYTEGDQGAHIENPWKLDVHDIGMETLKAIRVWDELSKEVQKDIEEGLSKKTQAVHDHMDRCLVGRKQKYPNVPRELTCTQCGDKSAIPPGILAGRVEKIASKKNIIFTVEDYCKGYICRKCKRGSMEAVVPTKLVCSCGKEVSVIPSILLKRVEKLGVSLEEYKRNFKCQGCFSTKGRKSTGKSIKIDLVCKCGNKVSYPTSAIIKMAEKKGITMERFVSGYQCQSCHPSRRGRAKKIK